MRRPRSHSPAEGGPACGLCAPRAMGTQGGAQEEAGDLPSPLHGAGLLASDTA